MTLQFAAGILVGVGLTLFSIFSIVEYLRHKELKKSELIQDLLNERNHYKDFYDRYRDRVDSGY